MKKLMLISFVLLASLVMIQPLMAAEVTGQATVTDNSNITAGVTDNSNITTGFKWDHCVQTYHPIGNSRTYCYLEATHVWVWTSDDRAENILIAAAASHHWIGINFTSTSGSWNYITLYKY